MNRPASGPFVELGEVQEVGSRAAGSAVQGVLDHEHLRPVAVPKQLEDEGVLLDVVLADPAAAEPARPHGRPPAVPAVHRARSRRPSGPLSAPRSGPPAQPVRPAPASPSGTHRPRAARTPRGPDDTPGRGSWPG